MAGFLPSAPSPALLCLPEGIIHLALSLSTTLSGRTHTDPANTLILMRGMFTWLQGKSKRWESEKGFCFFFLNLCNEHDQEKGGPKEKKRASSKCFQMLLL